MKYVLGVGRDGWAWVVRGGGWEGEGGGGEGGRTCAAFIRLPNELAILVLPGVEILEGVAQVLGLSGQDAVAPRLSRPRTHRQQLQEACHLDVVTRHSFEHSPDWQVTKGRSPA